MRERAFYCTEYMLCEKGTCVLHTDNGRVQLLQVVSSTGKAPMPSRVQPALKCTCSIVAIRLPVVYEVVHR
jgi:hypothetical protein